MEQNEQLIKRIEKLLIMAERGTEHEKKIALVKAQRLMLEHRIEIADIFGVSTDEVTEVRVDDKVNCYSQWILQLVEVVTKNFRCRPLYARITNRKGKLTRCWVVGLKTDAEICKTILEKAFEYIQLESKNIVNYHYRNFGVTKGIKQDFIEGFLDGLENAYHEQLMSNNQFALVVQVPKEVNDHCDTKGSIELITNNIDIAGLDYVRDWGYRKGKDFVHGEVGKIEEKTDLRMLT